MKDWMKQASLTLVPIVAAAFIAWTAWISWQIYTKVEVTDYRVAHIEEQVDYLVNLHRNGQGHGQVISQCPTWQ